MKKYKEKIGDTDWHSGVIAIYFNHANKGVAEVILWRLCYLFVNLEHERQAVFTTLLRNRHMKVKETFVSWKANSIPLYTSSIIFTLLFLWKQFAGSALDIKIQRRSLNCTPFVRQYDILLASGVFCYAKRSTKQTVYTRI